MFDVRKELEESAEKKYAEFSAKLIPGEENVLGVRLPKLRQIAKRICSEFDWREYVETWKPHYFEDYLLRGFVISYAKTDIDERLEQFRLFIPLIENWSVCDSFSNTWKPDKEEKQRVWNFILPYLDTGEEFKMRYSAVMMLTHFIDDEHIDEIIGLLDSHHHDGYYYKMGAAWTLSVCFAKYPGKTYAYISGKNSLDDETFNMLIGKIRDSYRISDEMKIKTKALKR